MKKIAILLVVAFSMVLKSNAYFFDVSKNGLVIVVHESNSDLLNVYNTKTETKHVVHMKGACDDWLDIVRDSLVLVHCQTGSEESQLYSLNTGLKVAGFSQFCFVDINEKFLYYVDFSNTVGRFDVDTYKPMTPLSYLQPVKGYLKEDLFEMSDDGKRIAIVMNSENKKKSIVALFELSTGKLIRDFHGFTTFDEDDDKTVTYSKKDVHFLDLNRDGSKFVIGNNTLVSLYDVSIGKRVAKFEEQQKLQREFFTECFFSHDYSVVYVPTKLRIYTLNPNNLTPGENIIAGVPTTNASADKKSGHSSMDETYFQEYFTWDNLCMSEDGRYMFSLCLPGGNSMDKAPYVWRKNIKTDEPVTYYDYK